MSRLDVYPMPGRGGGGYLVDVQADLLSQLSTRIVVPLFAEGVAPRPVTELNPVFEILGARYVLVTQAMASVPVRELKGCVATLGGEHDRVTRALDVLLVGF